MAFRGSYRESRSGSPGISPAEVRSPGRQSHLTQGIRHIDTYGAAGAVDCEGSGLRASRGLRLPSACAEGEEARGPGVDQKLQVALHPRAV